MKIKPKLWMLLVFVVVMYLFTTKMVMPFVLDVVGSDLFFKKTEDDPVGELHNSRTYSALLHCENDMRRRHNLNPATSPSSAESEYKAWGLGDHTYVVKSQVDVPAEGSAMSRMNMACKIKFSGDQEANPEHWNVFGIEVNPANGPCCQ